MTADSETSERKDRRNKKGWKKRLWKEENMNGWERHSRENWKRMLRQTKEINKEKGLKNMESSEGSWCKERQIDKQLKHKSKNVLKWKSAVEKADEKAAKFHL